MALFLFTKAILAGRPIDVFNEGKVSRDFTYIDDIVEGVFRVADKIPNPNVHWNGDNPDPGTSFAPYKIYNIGNNNPVRLMDFIETIEKNLGKKALNSFRELLKGLKHITTSDVKKYRKEIIKQIKA